MGTMTVSAFRWVPPFARGYVRDLRVRWALEEAGCPYDVTLIDFETAATEGYREWQPFGQVPAFRTDEVEMFESGAIVLHLADQFEALAPRDVAGQARVKTWVLAALNSIEPHVAALADIDIFHSGKAWTVERRPQVLAMLDKRLDALAACLGDKEFLEGRFTAGDLMMTTVLRDLVASGVLARFPTLDSYRNRCEARPAFIRALADQMAAFVATAPAE